MAAARKSAARSSTRLPHARISASLARRFVAVTLHRWGLDAQVEVAALLTGELVTNAIVHTPAPTIGLVVHLSDHVVRVEVHDTGARLPRPDRAAARDDQGGRGLALVAALATRWGVDDNAQGDGKSVWFEVPTQ